MSFISHAQCQIQLSFCMFSRGECQQEREVLVTCRDREIEYISLSVDEPSTSWCRGMFPLCSLWDRSKTVIVLIQMVYSHILHIQTHLVVAKQKHQFPVFLARKRKTQQTKSVYGRPGLVITFLTQGRFLKVSVCKDTYFNT